LLTGSSLRRPVGQSDRGGKGLSTCKTKCSWTPQQQWIAGATLPVEPWTGNSELLMAMLDWNNVSYVTTTIKLAISAWYRRVQADRLLLEIKRT